MEKELQKINTRTIVLGALFAAATTGATLLHIPFPTLYGYFNIGEIMVYTSAFLMGKWIGAIAGGLGSALADLILGYAAWAPYTLLVKGAEGFIVGTLAPGKVGAKKVVAVIPGAVVMILGYTLFTKFIFHQAFIFELGTDILQATVGTLVAIPLAETLSKIAFTKPVGRSSK